MTFNAVELLHGNFQNQTTQTRISIDFRVIPESEWTNRSDARTINTRMPFDASPGGYFAKPRRG